MYQNHGKQLRRGPQGIPELLPIQDRSTLRKIAPPRHTHPLETTPGRKYVKITGSHGVGRSAWAFIEIATGNILKAASWNAPAKHARGNIYRPETWTTVTVYGPQCLR